MTLNHMLSKACWFVDDAVDRFSGPVLMVGGGRWWSTLLPARIAGYNIKAFGGASHKKRIIYTRSTLSHLTVSFLQVNPLSSSFKAGNCFASFCVSD